MEQKTLEYEGSLCKEELILKVDSYRCKNRLFIAMVKKKDQEEELYDILTVSLPGENIKINEAFISDFECKYKLSFIRKYKLGEVLQRVGHSGFCDYRLVRFDLEKLAEYDREGVKKFLAEQEVTDIRFRNMILAMTRLCNDYLGTSVPVYGGEGLAEEILREIIRPPYTMSVPAKNKWGILVYKTKRMLHTHRACNSVLRISLCKWVGNSILLHLRSPHTIFQTERK